MDFLKTNKKMIQLILRIVVLVLGIGFLIFGAYRGEMPVVFGKATTICMQCIGLG